MDGAGIVGEFCFGWGAEIFAIAEGAFTLDGQIVAAEDHVLRRNGDWAAILRVEDVVCCEHEDACFGLSFGGQWHVNGHLVAVEVGVVSGAGERMQLQRTAFNEHRLEGLDAESVQGRCTVEKHRMVFDHVFEHVPDGVIEAFNHAFRALDVVRGAVFEELAHDEWLEEFNSHFFWQAALVHLELWADDDNGTAGIVDTLTEQVLTETTLFPFEHVRQTLQRTVTRTGDRTATTTVVDEGVDGFLEHALFVAHDDVWRAKIEQTFEAVVAVQDTTIEIVEVTGRKTAAVELDHRTDVRWDDWQHIEHHPGRIVAGGAHAFHHFEAANGFDVALTAARADLFLQLCAELVEIDLFEQFFSSFGANASTETVAVLCAHVAVFAFTKDLIFAEFIDIARIDDNVRNKVDDAFQLAWAHVEDEPHAAWNALEVPDVGARSSKLNVAHALTTYFRAGDFYTAAVTDDPFEAHAFVLPAGAFPVLGRPEDALAEQTVAFWLEGSVVDGFRFFYFTAAPAADDFRAGKIYRNMIDFIDVSQKRRSLLNRTVSVV